MSKRPRPVGSLPLVDVLAIRQIDLDKRRPVEAVSYGCSSRCHSREPIEGTLAVARFAHILGISYDTDELANWGHWSDVLFGDLDES